MATYISLLKSQMTPSYGGNMIKGIFYECLTNLLFEICLAVPLYISHMGYHKVTISSMATRCRWDKE